MSKTVYVLGELNVDLIMTGKDVTPEWNREKLVETFDQVLGSSSAITACGLAGLGLDVRFVNIVGDDSFGDFCLRELRNRGVNTDHVIVSKEQQTGVTLSLSTAKDRALLTYMGSISQLQPGDLPEDLFALADHIHFGSYYLLEKMRPHWVKVFRNARANGIQTSFDTGWDPHQDWHQGEIKPLLKFTDWFIPSEDEFTRIFGTRDSLDLDQVLQRLPLERGMVAIKRGARGALLLHPDGERMDAKAFAVTPVDTTGAGDSFNAGLIYASLTGLRGTALLKFASACGALATQRLGGASSVPTLHEVERFLHNHEG